MALVCLEKLGIETAINGGPFAVVVQVYGPATACLWDDDWDKLDEAEQGARMPWQGVIALLAL